MKYTPADCKQTFSLLLCQRSQAFQQLGDYERALEDAKTASMMNPDMSEVIKAILYNFVLFSVVSRMGISQFANKMKPTCKVPFS